MRRVGHIPKGDYQKKIKPLIKKYGFITKNYTYFKLENYRLEFIDDLSDYSREYHFHKLIHQQNPIRLYIGYSSSYLVEAIEKEMVFYNRKYKINNLLNS